MGGFSAKKFQHGRTSLCSRWCFSRGHRDFFWGWWSMAWIAMGPIFCRIYALPAPSKVLTKLIKHLFSSKTSQFFSPKTIQNNLKNRTCLQRFEGFFSSDSRSQSVDAFGGGNSANKTLWRSDMSPCCMCISCWWFLTTMFQYNQIGFLTEGSPFPLFCMKH